MSTNRMAVMLAAAVFVTMAPSARARAQGSLDAAAPSCAVDENSQGAVQRAAVMLAEAISAKTDSARRIPLLSADKALAGFPRLPTLPMRRGAPTSSDGPWCSGSTCSPRFGTDRPQDPRFDRPDWPSQRQRQGDRSLCLDRLEFLDRREDDSELREQPGGWWRQGIGWFRLVQIAVQQANTGHFDSASVTATQAARIYSQYPYTSFVMGQVAESKRDHKTAIAKYNEVIEQSRQDSSYAPIRRTAEVVIGRIAL